MIYSFILKCLFYIFIIFGISIAHGLTIGKENSITFANADLQVLVKEKSIKVNMDYTYVAFENNQTEIRFYLTSDVIIDYLKGDNIKKFEFNLQAFPLPTCTIFLKKPLSKGEVVPFSLSYGGHLKNGFHTDAYQWIDLDSDYILFPLFTNFQLFNYTLKANLDEREYKFIEADQLRLNNIVALSPKVADYAFTSLFACKNIKFTSIKEGKNKVVMISNQPDSANQKISNPALRILKYYNSTFGKDTPKHEVVIIVKPITLSLNPVQKTVGNLIVLASNSNEETLAHEISHLWWSRGNHSTMEKWLTESFAVYSQLMYLRSSGDQQKFDKEMALLKIKSEKLPALLKADRFGYDGNTLIYSKGPCILFLLEKRIGEARFTQFLSVLNQKQIITTQDFLFELEKYESKIVRDEIEHLLN